MASDDQATKTDDESGGRQLLVAFGPAALALIAALYSLYAVCNAGHAAATEAEWKEAAAAVEAGRTPGELIVFAPAWIDPLGRAYLGDQMDIAMAARMDAARYSGVWEVSLDGARAAETHGLGRDSDAAIGPLRVRHYPQKPAIVRYDFTESWKEATASGAMQGRPTRSLEEVGFEPHYCIKVIPKPDQTAVLRYDEIALGTHIVGYVGLADIFTRRDVRDPGRLEVLVNGKPGVSIVAGIDDGWKRFEVATTPGQGSVEFHLTAVGAKARDRRICFAAEARE